MEPWWMPLPQATMSREPSSRSKGRLGGAGPPAAAASTLASTKWCGSYACSESMAANIAPEHLSLTIYRLFLPSEPATVLSELVASEARGLPRRGDRA